MTVSQKWPKKRQEGLKGSLSAKFSWKTLKALHTKCHANQKWMEFLIVIGVEENRRHENNTNKNGCWVQWQISYFFTWYIITMIEIKLVIVYFYVTLCKSDTNIMSIWFVSHQPESDGS